ncbi:MAG: hypothetical protein ACFCVC_04045 [Acidimicrobiia bacterium]
MASPSEVVGAATVVEVVEVEVEVVVVVAAREGLAAVATPIGSAIDITNTTPTIRVHFVLRLDRVIVLASMQVVLTLHRPTPAAVVSVIRPIAQKNYQKHTRTN